MLNQSLQAKLGEDAHRRGELEAAQDRKDRELAVYKKKIEDLSRNLDFSTSPNLIEVPPSPLDVKADKGLFFINQLCHEIPN